MLANGVEITAVIDRRARLSSWHGCFIVFGPWPSRLTEPLTLEIEDGRSGEIVVIKVKHSGPEQTTAFFDGRGAID